MVYPTTKSFKDYLKRNAWEEISVRNGISTWEKGIYHLSFDVKLKRVEKEDLRVLAYTDDRDLDISSLVFEIHVYSFHNYEEFLTHSDPEVRKVAKKAREIRVA